MIGKVLTFVLTSAALAGVARAEDAVVLAPHHATYKLSLTRSMGDKAPAGASGVISYDFSGSACDGYATTFRQMTEMQPPEGESRVSDMHSATFEDGDAKQFRFTTQTSMGTNEDDVDGQASKQAGGDVEVLLNKPKTDHVDLKPALFPTEHLRKVIEAAREGKKLLPESVYDGSDTGKNIYDTLTVIGAPATAVPAEAAAQADDIKSVRRWPVSISYFSQGKNDAQPDYVMSFDLYENGVSRALKLDYGTFTLSGELTELKLNPVAPCKK